MRVIVFTLFLICGCFCSRFRYKTILNSKTDLFLEWNVSYQTESVIFRLKGKLKLNEWLGFGFSDYGEPVNADLVLYWRDHYGNTYFKDAHTNSDGGVHIDRHQNYIISRDSKYKDDWFVIEFERKFETCDENDYTLDNGTTHIIFFIGFGFPAKLNLHSYDKGLQRVQLLKPEVPEVSLPADTITIDITNPKITVPSTETTYWWHVIKLPDLQRKSHIIKYEGIIEKGNEHLVHHMEVFHCEVGKHEVIPAYNGPGMAEGKPHGLSVCRRVIGAWAMGATPVTLPIEAGTPIGGPDRSRYVLLEVHYNNPDRKQGIVDSSGIRLYVTKQLRRYDSAIMELGLEYTDKMAIPPHQKLFPLTGYCIPKCTEVGLPEQGIKIFASQLHTHLTGKRVFTKHIRHGEELPELNRDNHYSPHFQEIRILPEPVEVLPGDSLVTTCEDDTSDRENITLGGFSIKEEMCVNYVHYYPATDLEVCKSSVDSGALQTFFNFMKRRFGDKTSPHKGIADNYRSIEWTPHASDLLRVFYDRAQLSMQCNKSDGSRFPGSWNSMPVPKLEYPMELPINDHDCSNVIL